MLSLGPELTLIYFMSTSSVFAVCSFKNNKLYDLMIWEIRSIYKIGSPHFVCWLVIIDSAAKLLSQNLVSFQWKSVEWKLDPAHDRNRIWDGHSTSCCQYEKEIHSKFCLGLEAESSSLCWSCLSSAGCPWTWSTCWRTWSSLSFAGPTTTLLFSAFTSLQWLPLAVIP